MIAPEPLTIFAAPRSFDGAFERIQLNSLRSWAALEPRPEILVFGNEPGTKEACEQLGLRWLPDLATTAGGLPVLSDLFARADRSATNETLAYVNIDIILMQDVMDAVGRTHAFISNSVLVGSPWNLAVPYDLDTTRHGWQEILTVNVRSHGKPPPTRGADVFVFPRRYFADVPPLAVGRFFFDTWLLSRARLGSAPVVDITEAALMVHQDHRGSSHTSGAAGVAGMDRETLANRANSPWWTRLVFRRDIPLVLKDGALRKRPLRGRAVLAFRLVFRHAVVRFLELTYRPRHAMGLYKWWRHSQ